MTHLKKSPDQTNSGMDIPDAAIERIARAMLPMIQRYYESDDGKRELAAWKQKHEGGNLCESIMTLSSLAWTPAMAT